MIRQAFSALSFGLVVLAPASVAGATTVDAALDVPAVCYSVPTAIETAPAGVGITTQATASASVGCTPTTSGGTRGFTMTRSGTATVSGGSSLFAYVWSVSTPTCTESGVTVGPFFRQCSGTTSTFCAAPGTGPCSATSSSFASVVNVTITLDRADADDSSTVTCRYLA